MTEGTSNEEARLQVLHAGVPLEEASAAVILLHGRGATAESILGLGKMLDEEGEHKVAWCAPQAPGNTWYPLPFMEPIEDNEPYRTSALVLVDGLVGGIEKAGVPKNRIGAIGFSQGACLALEHASVGDNIPAFVGALSGGVMGPDAVSRKIEGSRQGLRVFIGCGDRDGHIPIQRAEQSAELFADAGAKVDFRRYDGMDHTINDDEINALREELTRLADGS